MSTSPYRAYHAASYTPIVPLETPDLDPRPMLAIFWVTSLIRALYAFWVGQGFGVEATLAVLVVIAVPVMLFDRPRREQQAE